ncbi:interleukin 21 receptor, tandem duplicate 1 [Pagrus major]|uniref:interleukin 21 receptor, tandem duplicate 1 n=1 Tax=Pagrus major TaxID=143350 RepID=UPI003CC84E27
MALPPVFLLLLWDLTLFSHGVTSFCNVTCSTDYETSLNCSCTGPLPTSVLINVKCRGEDGAEVNDSCEVTPPQSWCVMSPDMFIDVASIGTNCNSTVIQHDDSVIMNAVESSSWALSDMVKLPPPFDVKVTTTEGLYNFSWVHNDMEDCLEYTVRIRESKDLSKDRVYSLSAKETHVLLEHEMLQPHFNYTVDVQTRYCPGILYDGPWSEWSSTAEWTTTESSTSAETENDISVTGVNYLWLYIAPSIILGLGLLLILYFKRRYLWNKIQVITYIPRPDRFFKPLYNNYGGNFKDWVKPVFSEYDYMGTSSQVQMRSEKQPDVLQWNNEKPSYMDDNETRQGGHFLHVLQPHSNSLLFFPDGGSSQGTGHSTGHISIHTVTLSGEEEFEEEVASQRSLRSYQDGESFGSFREDNREQAGFDLEEHQMARGLLPHRENQISNELNFQPHVQLNEPERVSLDSFVSNEASEDGYPHVDLDTIDSGFGECSSPGASDSNSTEQIDSDSFPEHKSSNSNYVKQWMVCSTIQEDSSNAENERHEIQ